MTQKQFHIVKILNDSEFIINAGTEDGTKVGDQFKIIGHEKEKIIDPLTKDELGTLETSKGNISVSNVMEKMSIATAGTRLINPVFSSLSKPLVPDFMKKEHISLNVDLTQVSGSSTYIDEPIHIGDKVTKIND